MPSRGRKLRGGAKKLDGRRTIASRVKLHDELAAFEEFKEEVLPMLRKDLKNKLSPSQIRKKYLSYLTARQVTIGLTARDEAKSLAAIKDVFDREEGKAKESKDVTHRFEDLPDDQLDALVLSQIADADFDGAPPHGQSKKQQH